MRKPEKPNDRSHRSEFFRPAIGGPKVSTTYVDLIYFSNKLQGSLDTIFERLLMAASRPPKNIPEVHALCLIPATGWVSNRSPNPAIIGRPLPIAARTDGRLSEAL